jgi:lactoylglutathione lyase
MKLAYTIIYVPDVPTSLAFFEAAFGMTRKFLHESGTYGELATGETTLSFAAHELGDMNFSGGHVRADTSTQPLGFEIGLVTDDVAQAHARALAAGARGDGPTGAEALGADGIVLALPGRAAGGVVHGCRRLRR